MSSQKKFPYVGSAFNLYLGGSCLGFWPGRHQLLPRHLWVYLVTAGKCQVGTLKWTMTTSFTDCAVRYLQSSNHPCHVVYIIEWLEWTETKWVQRTAMLIHHCHRVWSQQAKCRGWPPVTNKFPMCVAANSSWCFVYCVIILCVLLLPHVYCFTTCVLLSYIL